VDREGAILVSIHGKKNAPDMLGSRNDIGVTCGYVS